MRKAILLLLSCVIVIFASCIEKKEKVSDISCEVIKLDYNEKNDIFLPIDTVSFIKIEDNYDNPIHAIYGINVHNDTIYIFDKRLKRLLSYDKQGRFLYKFGELGNSKSEYIGLNAFDVDNKYVYLNDRAKKKMLLFTHNGTFVKSTTTKFRIKSFKALHNGNMLISIVKDESMIKLCLVDSVFNIKKTFATFNQNDKDDLSNYNLFQKHNNMITYNDDLSDSIIIFNKNGEIEKSYYVDFGAYSVSTENKYNFENIMNETELVKYAFISDCPLMTSNNIFIPTNFLNKEAIIIYDNQTKKNTIRTIELQNLNHKDIINPLCYNNGYIYSWIDNDCLEYYSDIKKIPIDIQEHLHEGGFVLISYKLKE